VRECAVECAADASGSLRPGHSEGSKNSVISEEDVDAEVLLESLVVVAGKENRWFAAARSI